MTTIAFAHGMMAGDRQINIADSVYITAGVPKIAKDANGVLYGVSGVWGKCCAVLEAIQLQARTEGAVELPIPQKDDDYEILIAYPSGQIRLLSHGVECIFDGLDYYAIGGGSDFALGAMFAGASAAVAVEAASAHHTGTGGEVDCLSLGLLEPISDGEVLTVMEAGIDRVYQEIADIVAEDRPISGATRVLYGGNEESAEDAFDRIARSSES